jgi:TolB protein
VDYLQIVCNGKAARELDLSANRTSAYVEGKLPLESSGWCILHTFTDKAEYSILDLYPYATTSPVYVDIAGAPLRNGGCSVFRGMDGTGDHGGAEQHDVEYPN